eukprot:6707517-Pyramimonas_sp.AAC.3
MYQTKRSAVRDSYTIPHRTTVPPGAELSDWRLLAQCLMALKSKFYRVFFTPGNQDLLILPDVEAARLKGLVRFTH